MKVIPTHYKGYFFRSRLEARWAVFFDALNLEWKYEPEGFQFDDGTRYLPDFWLPQLNLWVEVKGLLPRVDFNHATQSDLYARKLNHLRDGTNAACMMVSDPMQAGLWLGFQESGRSLFKLGWFVAPPEGVNILLTDTHGHDFSNDLAFEHSVITHKLPRFGLQFDNALRAFRSARFEFGANQ